MADNERLQEIALQLRHPNGSKGIQIANMMNETNIQMTVHSIDRLNILDNENVLELGHGNCGHLAHLFRQNKNLTYYGLEISELMFEEAKRINQVFIDSQRAHFCLYDGLEIPFADNFFNKIFTVNTIYFWSDPVSFLSELYRVLKPDGILNITYLDKEYMQKLPFMQFGFTFYDHHEMERLINKTQFKVVDSEIQTENVKNKAGDLMERRFTTFILEK